MNENRFPKIILIYYALALAILFSAFFSLSDTSIPMFMSLLLLIPIYTWYKDHQEKEKLSREINGRDKNRTLQWIYALFILALSTRVPSALLFGMPYEKTPLICLIIMTIVLIEKTDISAFGFKTENIEKSLLQGFILFIVLEGSIFLGLICLVFTLTNQLIIASYSIELFLFAMPFQILCVGISEEGLFRGYMQTHLRKFYSSSRAILIQAAFFGIWHFVWNLWPFDPVGMIQYVATTFLIGLLFGYFYSKSKNLLPLIFAHGLYNSFITGIIENKAASNALQAIPVTSQILTLFLPYAISAIVTFFFIKHFVKEI